MNTAFHYFIEANTGLLILLVFNKLVLGNETNFIFKRYYLIVAVLSSLVFPLININLFTKNIPLIGSAVQAHILPVLIIGVQSSEQQVETGTFTWENAVLVIYLIGAITSLSIFVFRLIKLVGFLKRYPAIKKNKYKLVEVEAVFPTFSFFNYIVIGNSNQLSTTEKQIIIDHESVHTKKYHSLDILLIEAVIILFWFNPAIRIYKKLLTDLHEFQADQKACEQHDVKQYCNLLARVALTSADFKLANHFNSSLTLKRITMITTNKRRLTVWKMAGSAFTILAFFFLVSVQAQTTETTKKDNKVYVIVEQLAEPSIDKYYEYLTANIEFQKYLLATKTKGEVIVEFIVQPDGSLSEITVVKGINESIDKEAIRVLKEGPKWNPGTQNGNKIATKLSIPFQFNVCQPASLCVGPTESKKEDMVVVIMTKEENGKTIVEGTVKTKDGKLLAGANVIISGTTRGCAVGSAGTFELEADPSNKQIVISYVGYNSKVLPY